MASKFICDCGESIRTNLFEGHDLHLMVSENLVDKTEDLNVIVSESIIVVDCAKCQSRYFIDNQYSIEKYTKQI